MADKTFRNHRVEYEGNVWHIDTKAWGGDKGSNRPGLFKVYRIHGDINNPNLRDALQFEADAHDLLRICRAR